MVCPLIEARRSYHLLYRIQVQFLYSAAILLSVPLQLFPAVRIMETGLFARSGKGDTKVKWLKNFFRFCIVMVCAVISYLGAADLDKFVSFIGCFAWCVPLPYLPSARSALRADFVALPRTACPSATYTRPCSTSGRVRAPVGRGSRTTCLSCSAWWPRCTRPVRPSG